jgi:hypothetical protein
VETTTSPQVCPDTARAGTSYRSDGAADRFMRRLLRVEGGVDRRAGQGAHNAFRVSVVISAIRCLITYVLVPVFVPILSLSGWVAAPIGIALCVYAVINGVISMRKFWRSDHQHRWMYTIFMVVVFFILGLALVSDLTRLGGMA